ncbi:MAG: methyltransferase domain-containing protein [Pseudomonadota bacterium]
MGCGTGLVAEALKCAAEDIDGIDISEEMLEKARDKGLYRRAIQADLTGSLDAIKNDYGAVVSAGTFTTGHLGPEPLIPLLDITKNGALFVIGVNKAFFDKSGFGTFVSDMARKGLISDLKSIEVAMYAKKGHDHSNDKAYALCYRKA